MRFASQIVNPYTNREAGITETRRIFQLPMAKSQDILGQIVTRITKPPGEETVAFFILSIVIIAKKGPKQPLQRPLPIGYSPRAPATIVYEIHSVYANGLKKLSPHFNLPPLISPVSTADG